MEVGGGATEVDGAQLCRVPHGAQGKQATLRRVLFLGTRQTV